MPAQRRVQHITTKSRRAAPVLAVPTLLLGAWVGGFGVVGSPAPASPAHPAAVASSASAVRVVANPHTTRAAAVDPDGAVENYGLTKVAAWRMEDSGHNGAMNDILGSDDGMTFNVVKHKVHGRLGTGYAYKFNGRSSYAFVDPAASLNLSPGPADFAFTIWVDTHHLVPGGDYNIMQKGQATDIDGQYKLELSGESRPVGFPVCTFKGDNPALPPVHVVAPVSVNDHTWHRLTCQRFEGAFRVVVDGRVAGEKPVPAGFGSIHPTGRPLGIGAKPSYPQSDFFPGLLDSASVSIAP